MNSDKFNELSKIRKEWVTANQKNRFEKGLESLLSKMYPGKAHFIYELLQNSEDAGATCVKFGLSDSALAYEHNGPKLFSFSDVEAITGIGISTKQDDLTQIGKFGVGFKAVYDYTDSPEIHSNGYDFKIENMVIPVTESVLKVTDTTKTIFKFPFDTVKKDKTTSMKEIAAGLNALDDRTLLFLKNIQRIEFKFKDRCLNTLQSAYGEALFGNQTGVIERIQLSNNLVRIKTTNTVGKIRESDWLIFSETKQIETSDKRTINCPIGIAFATGQNQEGQKVIIPCEPGQVFVYFPAEKETSNLKFHIHAPFSSTVARDSIHDDPDNDILKQALVDLFAASLPQIRDLGYLDASFLKILPNSSTDLPKFYSEFKERILEEFLENSYIPCIDGTYERATSVIRGAIKYSRCFTNDDIAYLYSDLQIRRWMISPSFNEPEMERFVKDLNIMEYNTKTLLNDIQSDFFGRKRAKYEEIIANKSDQWLIDFYLLLEDDARENELKRALSYAAIVRVVDIGNINRHVEPALAFFPPNESSKSNNEVSFVKSEIWNLPNETKKDRIRKFLMNIGVKEYSELNLIQYELDKQDTVVDASTHYQFIGRCIKFLKNNPTQLSIFRFKRVLSHSWHDESRVALSSSDQLVLDTPYKETGLAALCSINNLYPVSEGYLMHPEIILEDFVEFAEKIGVQTKLVVEETSTFSRCNMKELYRGYEQKRDTSKKISKDYILKFLEEYLDRKLTIQTSLLIWDALIAAPVEAGQAKYSPNSKDPVNTAPSTIVSILKNRAWIPDKDGRFSKPEQVKISELHPKFSPDYSNGLLKAINFGKLEEIQTADYQEKSEFAKVIGFQNFEEAEEIVTVINALKNYGVTDITEFLHKTLSNYESEYSQPFPEKAVKNPERREEKLSEAIEASPEKKFEKRERSVQVNKSIIDARTWLKTQYMNDNGEMICQICQNPMPFDKRDGQPYFESVEIFTKELINKEFEAAHIALCPVCSAKYLEYIKQDETAMEFLQHSILQAKQGVQTIPIKLDQKTKGASIRFVESHLFDLKQFLQKELIAKR